MRTKDKYDRILERTLNELLKNLIKKTPFKKVNVLIKRRKQVLGAYHQGTCKDIPLVELNMSLLIEESEVTGAKLSDLIKETFAHEICHALQDYNNVYFSEKEARLFAAVYLISGKVLPVSGKFNKKLFKELKNIIPDYII